jgi:uncharacterized protein
MTQPFAPFQPLADTLLGAFDANGTDGSHDLSHIMRVWRNAARIAAAEPAADLELLLAAVLLHDCVAVEKSSPLRAQASRLSGARAREIVGGLGWPPARIDALAHAIETHSFSAGLTPETLEARILQDADRLDAIGAVGIARCFFTGGRMGGGLYHPDDPRAATRALDDRAYALDHFPAKLFKVADGFLTQEGRRMAAARAALMRDYVEAFLGEVEG